jgi:hypothetical protein
MAKLRSDGETLDTIAEKVGLSKTHVARIFKEEKVKDSTTAKRWLKRNGAMAESVAIETVQATVLDESDTTPITEANASARYKIARAKKEQALASREALRYLEMKKELVPVESFNQFVSEVMKAANNSADALAKLHGDGVRRVILDHFAALDNWIDANL